MSSVPPVDAADAAPAKPKQGLGLVPIITLVVGAIAGAAGGAIGVVASGLLGGKAEGSHAAEPEHPAAPVTYVEIDNAFTANLTDTGRYLQMRISVSTLGGEEVAATIEKHKPALISAVLAVLGELAEADVANRTAKDRLRDRLKDAINAVLKERGEAARVEDVFLLSLVVQ